MLPKVRRFLNNNNSYQTNNKLARSSSSSSDSDNENNNGKIANFLKFNSFVFIRYSVYSNSIIYCTC